MVIMLLIRSLADAASDLRYSFGPDFATVRVGWRFGRLKKFRRSGHVPEKAQMLGLEVTICRSEADTKQGESARDYSLEAVAQPRTSL